jgi:hypothetical protein
LMNSATKSVMSRRTKRTRMLVSASSRATLEKSR